MALIQIDLHRFFSELNFFQISVNLFNQENLCFINLPFQNPIFLQLPLATAEAFYAQLKKK